MNKNTMNRIPSVLIGTLLMIALMLFMAIIIKIQVFPMKHILLIGGIFLLYAVIIILLTWDVHQVGSLITGCVLTTLLLVMLMIGTPYLTKALDTLDTITTVEVEVAYVGVYVRSDSSNETIADLTDGSIGVLKLQDKANTDKTLAQVEREIGAVDVNLQMVCCRAKWMLFCSTMRFWIC